LVGASSRCWSRSPVHEPHGVSARGSPAHPRAARHVRGLFVRPIGSLPDPSPRPWSPAAGDSTTSFVRAPGPSWRDSRPSQTHPSAVVPIRSRPALRRRTIPQQLRATPRQATTSGLPLLRALTRAPSGATPARRALQLIPAAQTGAVFPPTTGAVFLLGITCRILRASGLPNPHTLRPVPSCS
jgi:hypothetical protein